ncbi:mechanosensitive ion channel domain-containing protein [Nitrincola nitratireducens]|nr:mechanosensitive ion channel domain-containing protein [Nitrincola nitratireducens]
MQSPFKYVSRVLCALLMCVLLSYSLTATANQPSHEVRLVESQQGLTQALETLDERLAPMLSVIDDTEAKQWLATPLSEPLEQLKQASETTEEQKQALQAAADIEKSSTERLLGALERVDVAKNINERRRVLEERIAEFELQLRQLPQTQEQMSLSDIESRMSELRVLRDQLAQDTEQKQQSLGRLEEQTRTLATQLSDLSRELLTRHPTDLPLEGLSPIEELVKQVDDRRRQARLLSLRLDQQSVTPRIELLKLEILAQEYQSVLLAELLRQLENEFNLRTSEEIRELNTQLVRLTERDPQVLLDFPDEIQDLRKRIDQIAVNYEVTRSLQQRRDEYTRLHEGLLQTLASVQERLEVSGLTDALGVQFLEEQRRLNDLKEQRGVVRDLERELAQSRLRSISLRDEIRLAPSVQSISVEATAQRQLSTLRRDILNAQLMSEQQLSEQLRQNEERLKILNTVIDQLDQTLKESLLWWPSHSAMSLEWVRSLPAALVQLLDPSVWSGIFSSLYLMLIYNPLLSALTLIAVLGVYLWGRRAKAELEALAEQVSHRYTDNIMLTLKAIGWSLLRVLPIPMLLFLSAFNLRRLDEAVLSNGVQVLGSVLNSTAAWWLAGHLFLLFTSEKGVGRAHFKWDPILLIRLRRSLTWFLPVQLLLIIFLALAFGHPSELVYDVFGRLGLFLVVFLNGLIAWQVLAPTTQTLEGFLASKQRKVLRFGFLAGTLALLALTFAGYLLTVGELLPKLVDTLMMLSLVWLVHCIAARALILSETHLRLKRFREQKAKQEAEEPSNVVGEGAIELPEQQLSIEHISQQTRSLLRTFTFTGLVFVLFLVWADVLPALTWLDGITLWSRITVVGEAELLSRVSLQDFMLALLLAGVFTLASRNLPGLVEILLARSHLMEAAHSYTVTTLLRYAITVVAVVTIFSLLGLRWSELQWMVAALTLGLGFGLQEVVANFVSGLIMLFERPVRVGDTITIGEFSGTVARIRTRATTIIDWDNREIVVPNKNFITERLINWTLSDNVTRLVLPIGVSYSSDPEQVMEILLRIANEHPLTLEDPAPSVYFTRFGDSALSFDLRVYVCQMSDRLVTTSNLNVAILKAFREANIEIAFPQMDIHIRDVPREMQPPVETRKPWQKGIKKPNLN